MLKAPVLAISFSISGRFHIRLRCGCSRIHGTPHRENKVHSSTATRRQASPWSHLRRASACRFGSWWPRSSLQRALAAKARLSDPHGGAKAAPNTSPFRVSRLSCRRTRRLSRSPSLPSAISHERQGHPSARAARRTPPVPAKRSAMYCPSFTAPRRPGRPPPHPAKQCPRDVPRRPRRRPARVAAMPAGCGRASTPARTLPAMSLSAIFLSS